MVLPTRGQRDWDDELNAEFQRLDGDVQSAKADATTAKSTAISAQNNAAAAANSAAQSATSAQVAADSANRPTADAMDAVLADSNSAASQRLAGEYATKATQTTVESGRLSESALAGAFASKAEAATKAPGGALYLPGVSGNYVSTDDAADLAIAGDLDVRVHIALPSWAPGGTRVFAGQYNGTNADSWRLDINSSGGLIFRHYPGGVTANGVATTSSSVVPFSAGELKWIRVTLDVDNGAGGNDIRFYYSDDGETWTQLGNTLTAGGTVTLFNSPEKVILGASTTAGNAAITGELREVQIRDGIDGVVVANYKSDVPVLRYRDSTGKVWVVAGSSWAFLGKG